MRICSNPNCKLAGEPQPDEAFYRRKYQCIVCSRESARTNRAKMLTKRRTSPFVVDREAHLRLPGEPWRRWLQKQIDAFGGLGGGGMDEIATRMRLDQRVISRWLRESDRVDLDAVDRALCAYGTPWVLRDLYPETFAECPRCWRLGMHEAWCPNRPAAVARRSVGLRADQNSEGMGDAA